MEQGQLSLYEYAKQVISKEVPMPVAEMDNKIKELAEFVSANKYTMLLCNERRDFTIFSNIGKNTAGRTQSDIIETLSNRGTLLLVDKQEDGAYEIWIRGNDETDNYAYYMFDYSNAIVEV